MHNIATGLATYERVSSWSSQVKVDVTDMQSLHSMINIGITLVQITRNLRTLDCEPDNIREECK